MLSRLVASSSSSRTLSFLPCAATLHASRMQTFMRFFSGDAFAQPAFSSGSSSSSSQFFRPPPSAPSSAASSSSLPFNLGTPAASSSIPSATSVPPVIDPATNPAHIDNFEMSAPIKAALRQNFKIQTLFPIQAECYKPIVEGKDLIGRSKTGSGKTLAFVLPLVQRLKQFPPLRPPVVGGGMYGHISGAKCRVLILEPTRELANQVNMEILKLAHVRTAVLYGGAPAGDQMRALSRGSDVVVATPGRLLDMVQRGVLSLDEVKTVVLDEADEMLRMGFQEQVEDIMAHMTQPKQVLLFSATLPTWVAKAASRYLKTPVNVDKVTGAENTTPTTITHKAMVVGRNLQDLAELLRDVFESHNIQRAIVFSKTKRDCSGIADLLSRLGIRARELHGDVAQSSRDHTMAGFRAGRFTALVATDVAARGIDIPNVEMVINIGFPDDHAFYVHRSGRTGRAGKHGISLLLYHQEDRSKLHGLTKEIGAKFQQMQLPESSKKAFESRSLLSAKRGFTTIEVRGYRIDAIELEEQLRRLTKNNNLSIGRVENGGNDSSFTDIPNEVVPQLEASLTAESISHIKIAKELPEAMFGGRDVNWKTNGHGGGRGGGGRGGGRGGGFGGRSGGGGDRYGSRDGGDRYGSRSSSSGGGYGRDRNGGGSGFSRGGDRDYNRGGDRDYNRGGDREERGSFGNKW